MQDLTGQTLGQYRIVEPLGRGGMATVFKAFQPSLERYVAVKVLPPYYVHEEGFAERFVREARAVARLEHPHILPVYDFGQEGELTYIAMKYVAAGTLKDLISGSPMSIERTVEIVAQIGQALDYAHGQGIIHRDVKPSNVLMDHGEWALLMDFGLAKIVEGSVQLTASGVGVGTPAYMAPEQGQGHRVDHHADIYSLGIVLYEMLTGRVPFDAETPMAVVIKHITEPLPLPHIVNPLIPEVVELVILKALAKNPADRYASCGQMTEALRRALQEAPADFSMPPDFARQEAEIPAHEPLEFELPEEDLLPVEPVLPEAEKFATTEVPDVVPASVPETAIITPAHESAPAPEPAPAHVRARVAVPAARPRRRIPWWVWAVGGVAVIALIVVGLLVSGVLRPRDQERATATAAPPADGELVSPGDCPEDGRWVEQCDWQGHGQGICVYNEGEETPQKLYQDFKLQIDGRISWEPHGEAFVFGAFQPGSDEPAHLFVARADGSETHPLPIDGWCTFPTWGPTGEWIAFHHNGNLALVRPDGKDLRELWHQEGQQIIDIQWSPDGRRIAFNAISNGWEWPKVRQAWIIPVDGGPATLIVETEHPTKEGNNNWAVVFSLDGQQLAYVDQDGQSWMRPVLAPEPVQPLTEFPGWWMASFNPQWGRSVEGMAKPESPKVVEPCEGQQENTICVRVLDTNQVTRVLDAGKFDKVSGMSWSPDGTQIVFSAGSPQVPVFDHKLYVMNADGTDIQQITEGDTNDAGLDWSPNGHWIAFHRNCALWVTPPDGALALRLSVQEENICINNIAWSPDGQWIAFIRSSGGMLPGVWMINDKGKELTQVYKPGQAIAIEGIVWAPDGKHIAFWYHEQDNLIVNLVDVEGQDKSQRIDPDEFGVWTWTQQYWPRWGKEVSSPAREPAAGLASSVESVVVPPGGSIKLVMVADLSGPAAGLGMVQKNAVLLALTEAEQVKGFPFAEPTIIDDQCKSDMAETAARELVANPDIVGVIGHTCSQATMPALPVYQQAGVVVIGASCTNNALTEQGSSVFNRVAIRDDRNGETLNQRVVETESYQAFARRYQEKYGEPLADEQFLAAYAYDAAMVLIKAIEKIAVVDPDGNLIINRAALAQAARRTADYAGVTGPITLDEKGDRVP